MRHILSISEFSMLHESVDLSGRWKKKRGAVYKLRDEIQRLRHRVSRDMDSSDEKKRMVATIVRIIDKTGERVGNDESSKNGHYGVSNLLRRHIEIDGGTVTLTYVGKSGVKHKTRLKDDKVARNLRSFMDGKKDSQRVFTTNGGINIGRKQVNRYLSSFGITSKDLRGFKVNDLMSERLNRSKGGKDEKHRKKIFREILENVAKKIGHTPSVCRNSYLLPEIEEEWIKKGTVSM